jgi:hypothetical protein
MRRGFTTPSKTPLPHKGIFGNVSETRSRQSFTRVTSEPGPNRSERHKLTYPKIAAFPDAITVKLADRIANVEASTRDNPSLLSMYHSEYPGFRSALIGHGGDPALWAHLDQLPSPPRFLRSHTSGGIGIFRCLRRQRRAVPTHWPWHRVLSRD